MWFKKKKKNQTVEKEQKTFTTIMDGAMVVVETSQGIYECLVGPESTWQYSYHMPKDSKSTMFSAICGAKILSKNILYNDFTLLQTTNWIPCNRNNRNDFVSIKKEDVINVKINSLPDYFKVTQNFEKNQGIVSETEFKMELA
jgi:hypothetical protein